MTLEEAKTLYIGAGGPADHLPSEWESIHRDMEAVSGFIMRDLENARDEICSSND